MKNKAAEISVQVWKSEGVCLEQYAYTAGAVEPLSKHCHEEYQLGLSFDCQGEYRYRGAVHHIPVGNLSIIHSGEVHSPSDRTSLPEPAHFCMMHISPTKLNTLTTEMAEKPASSPVFPIAISTDSVLNRLFLTLQAASRQSQLEQDTALSSFLAYLIGRYALNRPAVCPLKPAHPAVVRARDYLQAYYASDISLDALATIAGLSRFHFCRVFRQELGLSPGAYQTQLRIAQAKELLMQGVSIKSVATMTGFYDQSHFGWHFKRHVGVTPGEYVSNTAIIS